MKLKDLKFTPGPWRNDGSTIFYDDGHETYCIVAESRDFLHEEVSEANASLISRAPEMLDKLKKAEEALNELFNLIDSGVLVRDISKDHLPEYTINALKLTLKLKDALTTRTEITDLLNS